MSDFERIKLSCLQQGTLWEDPDFPATQTTVFYHQTPPFHFDWKRPKEIYSNPSFILDTAHTSFDVVSGGLGKTYLGDKWLVSCLGVLYHSKRLFYRVVPANQSMDSSYAGIFRFRFWWCGQWVEVLVDDRLPTVNGRLVFLQTTHTQQVWPALLEKAYAKLLGSYEALKYGSQLDVLADLTGGIPESILTKELTSASDLAAFLKTASIVTAVYHPEHEHNHVVRGVELEMNCRIYSVEKVMGTEGPLHLVLLNRPLPTGTVNARFIDHPLWRTIPTNIRNRLMGNGFWVLYEHFIELFTRVEMVHIDEDTCAGETSLANKQKWQMKIHQGSWKRGISAGGCRNHAQFFHINPQIQIILKEPDTVVVSLNQHSVVEPKIIGFSVYKMRAVLTENANAQFFKSTKSTVNSPYSNSRQVSQRCKLDKGGYIIIPTTFEPRQEANFTLRVFFSTSGLKMRVMDFAPQMLTEAVIKAPSAGEWSSFTQYEAVFLQLADEHKSIDAFDLQELLDACLPNDYIKSCASIDTCRQIVLSLDKNGTGRISLEDFRDLICSLKCWQSIFKNHAVEKMGVLVAERFRDALKDVGFALPEHALALLVLRYMRKDGMIRFGDFVSAIMHLHRAFHIFNSHESRSSQLDTINLNLSEWLHCALMC